MGAQEQWQLRGNAPELYQRYLVPAMTAMWAADLVSAADLQRGERVLDVACGTGVVTRVGAHRVGATATCVGLDINAAMLDVARSVPPAAGFSPPHYCEGSAQHLPFSAGVFDVVFCQLGLQFFPDRVAALREMRRVLRDGGRLALNVFGPIQHNPATHALATALDRVVRPDASVAKRTEHALADIETLRALCSEAEFDAHISTRTKMVRFPSPAEYVQIQLAATPLAMVIAGANAGATEDLVEALIDDVTSALAPYRTDGGLVFPQEVHVLLASKRSAVHVRPAGRAPGGEPDSKQ